MTAQEVKSKFIPNVVQGGVKKAGEYVEFAVQNTSEMDILGYTKSCGCVGEMESSATLLTGKVPAVYKDTKQELYVVDGAYCQKTAGPNGTVRFFDPSTQAWVEDPKEVEGPVKATLFQQSIGVHMVQDVPYYVPKPGSSGELVKNPDYIELSIPITFWVLE